VTFVLGLMRELRILVAVEMKSFGLSRGDGLELVEGHSRVYPAGF